MKKLREDFYSRSSLVVAKELLGKIIVHKNIEKGVELWGRIVETEAYKGPSDKAAHSYNNRRTKRTEVMFGPGGRAYIYFIYGMYDCMNVVCAEENVPEAVLIRGLEPVNGLEEMAINRFGSSYELLTKRQRINLTNGPGKLCRAMGITRALNGIELQGEELFLLDVPNIEETDIIAAKRVGIDYAEEAKDFLWRYYIKDNPFVSKK
ncbi:DNA-3-methyladenine glycosylase [Alloiococcus sp. CFN-8]|uniref:DNA-3-methyladenine glycosylase n=1 Tax=Alloiococcus sp. CFN-8 TaxID=3416081 RepID=UPI003CF57D04